MKRRIVKRKIRLGRILVIILFLVSLTAKYIVEPIFIRTIQTQMSIEIQRYERSMTALKRENEALTIDIQQLSHYARIVAIARESGYERSHTNIITIGKND
jgi:cell division protein FtsL